MNDGADAGETQADHGQHRGTEPELRERPDDGLVGPARVIEDLDRIADPIRRRSHFAGLRLELDPNPIGGLELDQGVVDVYPLPRVDLESQDATPGRGGTPD